MFQNDLIIARIVDHPVKRSMLVLPRDTHREKASPNKTPTILKSLSMDIFMCLIHQINLYEVLKLKHNFR